MHKYHVKTRNDGDVPSYITANGYSVSADRVAHFFRTTGPSTKELVTTLTDVVWVRQLEEDAGTEAGDEIVVVSEKTSNALRAITDDNGYPLWEPAMRLGDPDTFMGRPIRSFPEAANEWGKALAKITEFPLPSIIVRYVDRAGSARNFRQALNAEVLQQPEILIDLVDHTKLNA